jgi:drug/metabolite transporter (DMT)-like permease
MNKKIALLTVLGAIFFFLGTYSGNITFQYLGVGTWLSGLIFFTVFTKFKEITSLILGLLVLHIGVLLLLKETISNTKLLGFVIFTIGIIFVLNSGFSDYIKKGKNKN